MKAGINREPVTGRRDNLDSKKPNNQKIVIMDEMKELILEYVINEYQEDEDDEITYETPLISSGFVDSFSMVSLKLFLEKKFGISIPDDQASPEAFDSINSIVDTVNRFLDK